MKKYLKILLSLTLIVALTLPAFGVMGASNTTSDLNDDEIQLLRELGIVPEGDITPSAAITRGELAHLASLVCGATDLVSEPADNVFFDVPASHRYYKDINALVSLGVLAGNGSGYFFPDGTATYGEACKMFSMILGHVSTDSASHVKVAKQIGVIDSMILGTESLTYGAAIDIAYNTLHSRMITSDVFGKHIRYKTDDCTALEYYHGLVAKAGILEGIKGTTLTAIDDTLKNDEVLINNQIFRYKNGKDLLGKAVVYYYNKDDEKLPTIDIQYIYENKEYNEAFEISADDIIGISGTKLNYYDGDNKREVTITGRADVLYNGIALPNWENSDFKPAEGSVILLNNDLDKEYDVVFIESYEYVISGVVDAINNMIYCTQPAEKILGSEDGTTSIEYYNQGRLAFFGGLGANTPLIIKESKNTEGAKALKIDTFTDTVSGAVESKTADTITVGGRKLELSGAYLEDSEVRLGENVTVYVHNKKAAIVLHQAAPGYTTAYLLGVDRNDEAFSSNLSIYVREENKAKVEYQCSPKVKIDGYVVSDIDLAMDKLRESASQTYKTSTSKWPYSQLIRYKKNADGLITYIDTLTYNPEKEGEDSLRQFKSILADGSLDADAAKTRRYFSQNKGWHDITTEALDFILPTTAKLFWIPNTERDNEDFFNNSHSITNQGGYIIEAYNVDEFTRKADYALIYFSPSRGASANSAPYIVQSVATSMNSKEEIVYEVSFVGTSSATYFCADDIATAQNLEVGNLVQIGHNYSGELVAAKKLYDAKEGVPTANVVGSNNSSYRYTDAMRALYGTVVEYNNEHIFLASSITTNISGNTVYEDLCAYAIPSNLNIYVYDRENNTVEAGSASDIISYNVNKAEASKIMLVTGAGSLKYIYIVD